MNKPTADAWPVWMIVEEDDCNYLAAPKSPKLDETLREFVFLRRCFAECYTAQYGGKVMRGWLFNLDPRIKKRLQKKKRK